MLISKCFIRVLIADSLYILYFKLGRQRRDISGISKGETFAVTREQTEGRRRNGTENADVAWLKVNFENGFDGPRRKSFPAVRFRNPETLICRRW